MHLTVLVENTAQGRGIMAEHGLSYAIQTPSRHILFDTGQGLSHLLQNNARIFHVDLASITDIVLSHGHYDHTGGLIHLLSILSAGTRIYAHPHAFEPSFSRQSNGAVLPVGSPVSLDDLQAHHWDFIPVTERTALGDGLFISGPIPRITSFEDTGGHFFRDAGGCVPDTVLDDLSLYHKNEKSIMVITGCAHSGIVNILSAVQDMEPDIQIDTLVGGLHLVHASRERIQTTVAFLKEVNPRIICTGHCTGMAAQLALAEAFSDVWLPLRTGWQTMH